MERTGARGKAEAMRVSQCALLFGVALFFAIVVFNNLTDYASNYAFVRHVLAMDTTFPGNHGLWRAMSGSSVSRIFYASIIGWEGITCVLCWWGLLRLLAALRRPEEFAAAKSVAVVGLTLGMLLWMVAFLDIGGEWFLMWQSKQWNGQEAAFRMFAVLGIVLLCLMMPESAVEERDQVPGLSADASPTRATVSRERAGTMLAAALQEARAGLAEGGVPVGAAIFDAEGRCLATGRNRRVQQGDPSIHGETDAFRNAGRQKSYRGLTMVTTLAPCWYCSGLIRQFGFGLVIVGESRSFSGGIDWLRAHGIEVLDLDSVECRQMMAAFIQASPEIWNEDIGEESCIAEDRGIAAATA